jgi:RimJ/RimL family protein N-acetyltransferase
VGLVLLPIRRDGTLARWPVAMHADALQMCAESKALYDRVGHEPPWICYLAFDGAHLVGACGFVKPLRNGRVEIAYRTFAGFEGRGLATEMARALIDLADGEEVVARTRPALDASAAVLRKLGFDLVARDGDQWEWQLR